ncbi:MAG TPA: PocR ligand-binding domain-containing protein, partial [Candidatus Methylacidiphilales bacterium]
MDIDASSLLALEMAPPAETLPHPAVEFEAADDGGATSKALALQRSSEIEKVFAQFTREILNPLTQLSKIPLLATSEPERYGDSPSQPPLCRASMLEQKSRSPCLRLHRDLRSRARATQKIQVSTCHIGYFLFVAPVGTSSTFFGFIEGGRAFKDKPADLSLIEPLLRVLRRNRPATDT